VIYKSVDEPITNYIPELRNRGFQDVTIRHLLAMSSGIKYKEGLLLWGDDTKTYYATDLRRMALSEVEMKEEPGKFFWYNNYHPLLLGATEEVIPVMTFLRWATMGSLFMCLL